MNWRHPLPKDVHPFTRNWFWPLPVWQMCTFLDCVGTVFLQSHILRNSLALVVVVAVPGVWTMGSLIDSFPPICHDFHLFLSPVLRLWCGLPYPCDLASPFLPMVLAGWVRSLPEVAVLDNGWLATLVPVWVVLLCLARLVGMDMALESSLAFRTWMVATHWMLVGMGSVGYFSGLVYFFLMMVLSLIQLLPLFWFLLG